MIIGNVDINVVLSAYHRSICCNLQDDPIEIILRFVNFRAVPLQ
jgi:hypothetical protein